MLVYQIVSVYPLFVDDFLYIKDQIFPKLFNSFVLHNLMNEQLNNIILFPLQYWQIVE